MKTCFPNLYLPSLDNEGKTWRIGYFKPEGRPGVVVASEGKSEILDGIRIFTCELFTDRCIRRQLTGRATKKAIALALDNLIAYMRNVGSIPGNRDT